LASILYLTRKPDVALPFISALNRHGLEARFLRPPARHGYLNALPQALGTKEDAVITDIPFYPFFYSISSSLRIRHNKCIARLMGDPFAESTSRTSQVVSLLTFGGLNFASGVIYVSKSLEGGVSPRLKRPKSFVVHNGVDLESFTSLGGDKDLFERLIGSKSRSVNVLSIMNFDIEKKLRFLPLVAEPMKRITKELDCAFFFIGSGPRQASVEELFRGTTDIHFLGSVEHSLLPKLIPQFDIFFHPSGLDALPSAVLEASACGLPVLASSTGGIPEEVDHEATGLLMADPEKQSYDQMKRLIEDGSLRRSLGRGARRKMEVEFNWNDLSESFVNTVVEILSGTNP
jgi:glycosyltransferase involved in cell wall biosynthesis